MAITALEPGQVTRWSTHVTKLGRCPCRLPISRFPSALAGSWPSNCHPEWAKGEVGRQMMTRRDLASLRLVKLLGICSRALSLAELTLNLWPVGH